MQKKFEMLNIIFRNCTLTSKEILVVQYFIYKSNQKGICFPAVNTIAEECGVSERTVQRATRKLQEKGYVSIEKRTINGRQTSNEYRLIVDDQAGNSAKNKGDLISEKTVSDNNEMKVVSFEALIYEAENGLNKDNIDESAALSQENNVADGGIKENGKVRITANQRIDSSYDQIKMGDAVMTYDNSTQMGRHLHITVSEGQITKKNNCSDNRVFPYIFIVNCDLLVAYKKSCGCYAEKYPVIMIYQLDRFFYIIIYCCIINSFMSALGVPP